MKRMVGRRVVEVGASRTELHVVVKRGWLSQDDFYSETDIGVQVGDGALTVTTKEKTITYAPGQWKTVTSQTIPARSRV